MLLITFTYSLNIMQIINSKKQSTEKYQLFHEEPLILKSQFQRADCCFTTSRHMEALFLSKYITMLLPCIRILTTCVCRWRKQSSSFDFAHILHFWSLKFVAATKYPISIKVLSMRISLQYFLVSGRNDPISGFLLSPDFSLTANLSTWDLSQQSLFFILEQS